MECGDFEKLEKRVSFKICAVQREFDAGGAESFFGVPEETAALEERMEDETVTDELMEAEEEPTEAYVESENLVEETEKMEELEETEEPEETEMLADDETPPRVFGTLNDYFRSKSWYRPIYTSKQFDAMGNGVFNSCEFANRDVLLVLEQVVGE